MRIRQTQVLAQVGHTGPTDRLPPAPVNRVVPTQRGTRDVTTIPNSIVPREDPVAHAQVGVARLHSQVSTLTVAEHPGGPGVRRPPGSGTL